MELTKYTVGFFRRKGSSNLSGRTVSLKPFAYPGVPIACNRFAIASA